MKLELLAAPEWLTKTFSIGKAPIPRGDVVRSAITIPLVLGVGLAAAGTELAIYAVLAALLVVLGERGGTSGQRLYKAGLALLGGTVAMWLGPASGGVGVLPVVTVAIFSVVSGVMSSLGTAPSFAGMQLLVQMSIAGGLGLGVSAPDRVAAYLIGGLAALVGIAIQDFLERGTDRYREALLALAAAIDGTIDREAQEKDDQIEDARRLDREVAATQYFVRNARPIGPTANDNTRRLLLWGGRLTFLAASTQGRWRPPLELRDNVADVRKEITSKTNQPRFQRELALERLSAYEQVRTALADLETWRFTLRLVICMVVAELLRQWDPLGHSYWLLLTTALILKPDLASVFSRTLQRGLGTVVGMLAGWVLTFAAPGPILLIPLAALSAMIPWTVRRSYAWFSILVTPLVFILLDFVAPTTVEVLGQRLANTLGACVIVLVVGYLMWPDTWRPRAERHVARICRSLAELLSALHGAPDFSWVKQRLAVSQDIAKLRLRGDQTDSEPSAIRARGHHWHDVADALELVLLEVTQNAPSIGLDDGKRFSVAFDKLASAVSSRDHGYKPANLDLPTGPLGSAVVLLHRKLSDKIRASSTASSRKQCF